MIYKNVFVLTGTDAQKKIVFDALEGIKFPFHELDLPYEPVEIGWRDLNNGMYHGAFDQFGEKIDAIGGKKPDADQPRLHGNVDHRKYILGVMYPGSGRLYIDLLLEQYPDVAKITVAAEVAHDVDYFHPKVTKPKRQAIHLLWHPDGDTSGHAEWWEQEDYGLEYDDLPAEAFMGLFIAAYTDWELGDSFSQFARFHPVSKALGAPAREILDIPRTDFQEAAPEPATTTVPATTTQAATTTVPATTTAIPEFSDDEVFNDLLQRIYMSASVIAHRIRDLEAKIKTIGLTKQQEKKIRSVLSGIPDALDKLANPL